MILLKEKPDSVGAIASTLCLIHCIATPVLFMVQSCALDGCQVDAVPTWWGFIDYVFLVIAFFAIYRSTKSHYFILD
ncbi:MerC domain-containing protein [Formosa algae]|uniref:MerC domain-containing protein n=1 Tax=Formosa algae TaxID=225843 RepID=UPI00209BE6E2|nr:MerC domain-containing protein [Formosa algae]